MENLKTHTITGIPIIQNKQDFVICKFSIEEIFEFTRYTQRILNGFDDDGEPLYNEQVQREIEPSRVKSIADFLIEDPEATFPTNIVLHIPSQAIESQEDTAELVKIHLKKEVYEEIKKENGDDYITIIDGQHRIKGIEVALERIKVEIDDYQRTLRAYENENLRKVLNQKIERFNDLKKIELVVSFFIDKTIEYQAMIFSTINRTQKRVSQSLVYSLFGLDTGDTPQKTALQVVITLNGHRKSPFYNRIKFYGGNYSQESSPPLSQATMVKSIVDLISESPRESERDRYRNRIELINRKDGSKKNLPFRKFYALDKDEMISNILFYYFSAVREVFQDGKGFLLWDFDQKNNKPQNIFHTTVGYSALLSILVDMLRNRDFENNLNIEFFKSYLNSSKDLNISDINRYSFNNRGKKFLYLDMSLSIWPPIDRNDHRLIELGEMS